MAHIITKLPSIGDQINTDQLNALKGLEVPPHWIIHVPGSAVFAVGTTDVGVSAAVNIQCPVCDTSFVERFTIRATFEPEKVAYSPVQCRCLGETCTAELVIPVFTALATISSTRTKPKGLLERVAAV